MFSYNAAKVTMLFTSKASCGHDEKHEMRNLYTGQHQNTHGKLDDTMTADEKLTHERSGRAWYDPRYEKCLKMRGTARHPRRAV